MEWKLIVDENKIINKKRNISYDLNEVTDVLRLVNKLNHYAVNDTINHDRINDLETNLNKQKIEKNLLEKYALEHELKISRWR